jgi:hypothetical protein
MGQQQLMLIILGMAIIGIALAVGLGLFSANGIQANKDAITHDLLNIFASSAYHHYLRPRSMGGGAYAFDDSHGGTAYHIPTLLASNANGIYVAVNTPTTCTITGSSITYPGNSVSLTIGPDGKSVPPGLVVVGPDFN